MPVTSLLHFALEVPDPQVGVRFYSDFGLVHAGNDQGAERLRPASGTRPQILLMQGSRKRLHHLALGAKGPDFAEVEQRLKRSGVALVGSPPGGPRDGLWLRDPDGTLVNVRSEGLPTPPADPPLSINSPGNPIRIGRRAIEPDTRGKVTPRRLGHVQLFTPDIDHQVAFYRDALGFRISDSVPGHACFMRCSTDHHNLAFGGSDRPGFHHASFEVGGVDEIAVGAKLMQQRGWHPAWGIGRHVIGSNFFHYIEDPWGSYAEYYCDLDYIPPEAQWQAREWSPEDGLCLWGPELPPGFLANKDL